MKIIPLLAIVVAGACTTADSDPTTSTQNAAVSINQPLPPAINAELWDPNAKDPDKLAALWPDNAVTSNVLYREGPCHSGYEPCSDGINTYLAFVVYNGSVQHVYWIAKGSAVGADFKQSWDNAFGTRTNSYNKAALFDHWGGGNGGGGTGPQPSPHPNVTNFVISGTWQQNAIDAAAAINNANASFLQYSE